VSATSVATVKTSIPDDCSSSASAVRGCCDLAASTNRIPLCASPRAMKTPSPLEAPVTIATSPLSIFMSSLVRHSFATLSVAAVQVRVASNSGHKALMAPGMPSRPGSCQTGPTLALSVTARTNPGCALYNLMHAALPSLWIQPYPNGSGSDVLVSIETQLSLLKIIICVSPSSIACDKRTRRYSLRISPD
jgi:hypothetical protein